jgi:hypothetical protein
MSVPVFQLPSPVFRAFLPFAPFHRFRVRTASVFRLAVRLQGMHLLGARPHRIIDNL